MNEVYKQWKNEKNENNWYIRSYIRLVVINCNLERDSDEVLKFSKNSSFYFELSASRF